MLILYIILLLIVRNIFNFILDLIEEVFTTILRRRMKADEDISVMKKINHITITNNCDRLERRSKNSIRDTDIEIIIPKIIIKRQLNLPGRDNSQLFKVNSDKSNQVKVNKNTPNVYKVNHRVGTNGRYFHGMTNKYDMLISDDERSETSNENDAMDESIVTKYFNKNNKPDNKDTIINHQSCDKTDIQCDKGKIKKSSQNNFRQYTKIHGLPGSPYDLNENKEYKEHYKPTGVSKLKSSECSLEVDLNSIICESNVTTLKITPIIKENTPNELPKIKSQVPKHSSSKLGKVQNSTALRKHEKETKTKGKNNQKEREDVSLNCGNKRKTISKDILEPQSKITKINAGLQPPSLTNMGATCYLNSAIQGISACNIFVRDINRMCHVYSKNTIKFLPVFKRLIDVINGCSTNILEISRNDVFCNWNKTGHQDSYELLAHVINEVYNEIRHHKEKVGEIPERDLGKWLHQELPMRFILKYKIECGCKLITYSPLQSDLALHVTIPKNDKVCHLDQLIDLYFADEYIEDYVCDRHGCEGLNTKRNVRLCSPLPRTVCIHLQRTSWNNNRMIKINKRVNFEMILILKSMYLSSDGQCDYNTENQSTLANGIGGNYSRNNLDLIYHLASVIVHAGTVEGGHYVCYKRVKDKWFLTNDSWVHEVNERLVLNSQAYILFYEISDNNG